MNHFKKFGFKQEILKGIEELFFKEPTPIQEKAIPLALKGEDVIGQAQTGTGKTAAFVLPTLQKLDPQQRHIQALILTPTRELAIQISNDIQDFAKYLDIGLLSIYGGKNIETQIKQLQHKNQIVVGTPGRILDHLRRNSLHIGKLRVLVLDEADKMLEMGFQEDVELIIALSNPSRQTLLFSATMPDQIKQLAQRFMKKPVGVRVNPGQTTSATTKQFYYLLNQSDKPPALVKIVQELNPYMAMIFVNTQKRAEEVGEQLQLAGLDARTLHGGLSQNKRQRLMKEFHQIKFQYLVCTDLAARGVDVEGVTHVINYDLPSDTESYIHRVGRTGRAGQEGTAISFVSPRQRSILHKIENSIGLQIEERLLRGKEGRIELPSNDTSASKEKAGSSPGHQRKNSGPPLNRTKQKEETNEKKQVKPGYRKKLAIAKKKKEQQQKRKRIQSQVNKVLQERRRRTKR